MGGVGPVTCQGFLVGGTCVCVLGRGELDLLSLECNEVSSSGSWGVYGFCMALGSPSVNAQGYVPVLLEN